MCVCGPLHIWPGLGPTSGQDWVPHLARIGSTLPRSLRALIWLTSCRKTKVLKTSVSRLLWLSMSSASTISNNSSAANSRPACFYSQSLFDEFDKFDNLSKLSKHQEPQQLVCCMAKDEQPHPRRQQRRTRRLGPSLQYLHSLSSTYIVSPVPT